MKKTTLLLSLILFLGVVSTFAAANLPVSVVINKSIPAEWTYITNNAQYPDPGFYNAGGLKMNFENQGIESPEFTSQSSVDVKIKVNALNENTKNAASEDVFTVSGLNSGGSVVGTATLKAIEVGDNDVTVAGTDIVKVRIIMTGYPYNGNKHCNVELGGVTVSATPGSGIINPSFESPSFYVSGSELVVKNIENGTIVEFYNAVGAKVQSSVFDGNAIEMNNLSKGIYIVRAGKYSQKVIF